MRNSSFAWTKTPVRTFWTALDKNKTESKINYNHADSTARWPTSQATIFVKVDTVNKKELEKKNVPSYKRKTKMKKIPQFWSMGVLWKRKTLSISWLTLKHSSWINIDGQPHQFLVDRDATLTTLNTIFAQPLPQSNHTHKWQFFQITHRYFLSPSP